MQYFVRVELVNKVRCLYTDLPTQPTFIVCQGSVEILPSFPWGRPKGPETACMCSFGLLTSDGQMAHVILVLAV